MTTAARGTSAPLGSLTAPAIAPVLAVWPCIGKAQSASTEARSKVRNACIEMFHLTSFLQQSPKEGEGRLYYSADSGDQTTAVPLPTVYTFRIARQQAMFRRDELVRRRNEGVSWRRK